MMGYVVLVAAILLMMRLILVDSFMDQAQKRITANLNVGLVILERTGDDFSLKDGKLYIGDHVLNGDNQTVDFITRLIGGHWTIFMGDRRIATNILKENGERAVGTKLATGPIYDKVLKEGQEYRGETNLLGRPFFVAYHPIKNKAGETLGILFVGLDKGERMAVVPILMENSFQNPSMRLPAKLKNRKARQKTLRAKQRRQMRKLVEDRGCDCADQ